MLFKIEVMAAVHS